MHHSDRLITTSEFKTAAVSMRPDLDRCCTTSLRTCSTPTPHSRPLHLTTAPYLQPSHQRPRAPFQKPPRIGGTAHPALRSGRRPAALRRGRHSAADQRWDKGDLGGGRPNRHPSSAASCHGTNDLYMYYMYVYNALALAALAQTGNIPSMLGLSLQMSRTDSGLSPRIGPVSNGTG